MEKAKRGNKVKVHYSGYLKDGTVFDCSPEKKPFEFTIGKGMVIQEFENAVIGMEQGDTKTITIPPENAYGDYEDDLIIVMKRSQIPSHIDPQIGTILKVRSKKGKNSNVTITDITEETITLDGNHPLAGKELNFEIKLLEII